MHAGARGNTGLQEANGHYQVEVTVVFASSSGAATRGEVASIVLRQGQVHLNGTAPNHDSPSTPLPTTNVTLMHVNKSVTGVSKQSLHESVTTQQ